VNPTYEIGKFQIQSYGLHVVLSCLVLLIAVAVLLRLRDQNPGPAIDLTLLLVLGQVVLAKLLWTLLSKEEEFITMPTRKLTSGFWGGQLGWRVSTCSGHGRRSVRSPTVWRSRGRSLRCSTRSAAS